MGNSMSNVLAAPLVLLLVACAGDPPTPTQAMSALPPEVAATRLVRALENAGLDVERRDAGLKIATDDPRFVRCLPIMVGVGGGDGSRRVFTQVSERQGIVDLRLLPEGNGTQAIWQGMFTGRYHDRSNNRVVERPCEGTGELAALIGRTLAG